MFVKHAMSLCLHLVSLHVKLVHMAVDDAYLDDKNGVTLTFYMLT
jgi:hypothetical protein